MSDCKIEIKTKKGAMSVVRAEGIRINGIELPNVVRASVHYTSDDVRRMSFELIPTDVIEVDEADW